MKQTYYHPSKVIQKVNYTPSEIKLMVSHLDALLTDVSSLTKQLADAKAQNDTLIVQNYRLASIVEETTGQDVKPTVH